MGVSLCARGAQQQAGQQVADKKKTELAVLMGMHVPDYKQIIRASQAPALDPYGPEDGVEGFLRSRSRAHMT